LLRQDEGPALLQDAARFLEGLHGSSDADPVGPHQKTQLFVGEGKLDYGTARALGTMFPSHLGQDLVKSIFQIGKG
jgi:hypothetical protein